MKPTIKRISEKEVEYVKEVADHPNYDAALAAAKAAGE